MRVVSLNTCVRKYILNNEAAAVRVRAYQDADLKIPTMDLKEI
jgi:hypothetical protein